MQECVFNSKEKKALSAVDLWGDRSTGELFIWQLSETGSEILKFEECCLDTICWLKSVFSDSSFVSSKFCHSELLASVIFRSDVPHSAPVLPLAPGHWASSICRHAGMVVLKDLFLFFPILYSMKGRAYVPRFAAERLLSL